MMTKIMGHRGSPADEPENTLRSFRRALAVGVAAVELDVQLTKDGRLAVIHDETLDRTTNGRGPVQDFTLAELKKLDAGRGEPVPSLEEVFDLVQGKADLVVELKQPEAAGALLDFFQERRAFEFATIISFWHPAGKAVKKSEPRLNTGVLRVGCPAAPVGLARAADAGALILQYAYVTPELVAAAHENGLLVYVWNIDDTETLKPYLTMNLDGIGSNRPGVLIEYLKSEQ
ncbi:MAG: glycerophosphodiester phosphodiesterase [Proteobacteria bacterium]|nr:glycerophosphodiester phosphodiesterase [Pseudomonadota bacterium]